MAETAEDWLGREYRPGDYILYSQGFGSSGSQMILAEVHEINDTTVTARVIRGSRGGTYNHKRLIDARTGRGIDPYNKKHMKTAEHWRHKTTGEAVSSDDYYLRNPEYSYGRNQAYYLYNREDYDRVLPVYWDYVTEGPYYKTLLIKDNVTKTEKDPVMPAGKDETPS